MTVGARGDKAMAAFGKAPSQEDEPKQLEGRHVLLVEDDPTQQRLFAQFLRQAGAEITLENNGLAGIDSVNRHPGRYALVITDIEMPFMSGVEIAREIRERGLTIPILAISGRSNVGLERESWQAGCDAFLNKPFTREQLVKQVLRLSKVSDRRAAEQRPHCLPKAYERSVADLWNEGPISRQESLALTKGPSPLDDGDLSDPMKAIIEKALERLKQVPGCFEG